MGRGWRDFFYFSKADRRALLLLSGVLLGVALTSVFFLWLSPPEPFVAVEEAPAGHAGFWDSLKVDTPRRGMPEGPVSYRQPSGRVVETFVFDPNTADSTTLLRLGLAPWQVRNLYKYRARGGRFHRPEDFSRLYGLTKGDYDRLRPCIRIADEFKLLSDLYPHGLPGRDSVPPRPRAEKFAEGTLVELNAADTSVLKKVPGIGSWRARQIADYRARLGGFVSVGQLAEVEGLPGDIGRWFTVEPAVGRLLYVNRMSVNELRRHPYLDFYQSRVIVEHRRKFGPIKTLQTLSLYEEFTSADLERLQPYVSFEE